MSSPNDRRYLQSHEWHKPEGDLVKVGISRFAVDELTDVTYVEVKRKSGVIKTGESFGEIESVKATSELYCGIDGTVVEVNKAVIDNPALINEDPYEKGWIIKVKPASADGLNKLMDAARYDQTTGH